MSSDPTANEHIVERRECLSQLDKRLQAFTEGYRQNVALVGPELIGKTSLISKSLTRLDTARALPIMLTVCEEYVASWIRRSVGTLLVHALQALSSDFHPSDDLSAMLTAAHSKIPQLANACQDTLNAVDQGRMDAAYSGIWFALGALAECTERRVVVAIDEFHRLADFQIGHPFSLLAEHILVQSNIMYVLSSSRVVVARRILRDHLTLLFGNFELIEVHPVDWKSGRRLLAAHFEPMIIPTVLADFLTFFSGGLPFQLKALCDSVRTEALANQVDEITPQLVLQALLHEIFRPHGRIASHYGAVFDRVRQGRSGRQAIETLLEVAKDQMTAQHIAHRVQRRPTTVSKQLGRLVDVGVLGRCGSLYHFEDRLFGVWVRHVYQRHHTAFAFDVQQMEQEFSQAMAQSFQRFLLAYRAPPVEHVATLFRAFRNHLVQVGGRRHRLPRFTEVTVASSATPFPLLTARGDRHQWLCSVRQGAVTERDVTTWLDQLPNETRHVNQKILVSLDDVDVHAKVVAKAAKVWIWDLESVNRLCELYRQPALIP